MTFDELKAILAAMTGPLPLHLADRANCLGTWTVFIGPGEYASNQLCAVDRYEDALGTVALHNAFPSLVERYEAMREALEEAEWNQLDEHGNWMCPVCDRLRDDSRKHSPGCSIGLALALVAKPLTETGS